MSFSARLADAVQATATPLCVGIDPYPDRLPHVGGGAPATRAERFGLAVVRAAAGRVPAVKPQFAFFEALGPGGMAALATVCAAAREAGLLVIGDAKRGDIGSTAAAYAAATLGPDAPFPCDALTVNPFLGPESLAPFLEQVDRHGRGLFVLLRTSNPGSHRWQAPVADDLAGWVDAENRTRGDGLGPVGVVVGATLPGAVAHFRAALPHTWLLLPGYGAQGAAAADTRAAFRPDGLGALVVAARAATFPEAPDAAWDHDPTAFVAARIDALAAELRTIVPC